MRDQSIHYSRIGKQGGQPVEHIPLAPYGARSVDTCTCVHFNQL